MPVQVGDLVGFYRRKTPGMGIILQKVDNILEHAGVDESVAFQIAENAQGRTYWEKKSAIQDLCDGQQVHSTSLKLFFQYPTIVEKENFAYYKSCFEILQYLHSSLKQLY